MTRQEAGELVALLIAAYPVPGWPDETMRLYVDMLTDLDHAQVRDAVRQWIMTEPARPSISDIRRTVVESAIDLPEPEEAYGMVKARFASRSPTDLPKAIMDAVKLTGKSWEDLAYMQYDQYPWFRRDFLNAYREVRDRYLTTAQQDPTALPLGREHRAVGREEACELLRAITKGNA